MTQPKRLPVAGLHRASPSATLDKSSCLYTLFGETDYLEYIQAPAICQMFFLLQPLALMIRPPYIEENGASQPNGAQIILSQGAQNGLTKSGYCRYGVGPFSQD